MLLIAVVLLFCGLAASQENPWDLPLFPSTNFESMRGFNVSNMVPKIYKIPRHIWISMSSVPKSRQQYTLHVQKLIEREEPHNWTIHLVSNEDQLKFMEDHYANTSTLWAFKQISPFIGVAASDLWRYSLLYVYGGIYLDDDSVLERDLDEVIEPENELILSQEPGHYHSTCYHEHFYLKDETMASYYNVSLNTVTDINDGKTILTWAILASPRHVYMKEVMHSIVELIKLEYLRQTVVTVNFWEPKWKLVMCVTGPAMFTASIRKAYLEHHYHPAVEGSGPRRIGNATDRLHAPYVRVEQRDFHDFRGQFKLVRGRGHSQENHYMHTMQFRDRLLLRTYQPIPIQKLEGKLLSLDGGGEKGPAYYFISENGMLHNFTSTQHVTSYGFTERHRFVLDRPFYNSLPLGDPVSADARLPVQYLEGELVVVINHRNRHDYYVIYQGHKHSFKHWDHFVESGLDKDKAIAVSGEYLDGLPQGAEYDSETHGHILDAMKNGGGALKGFWD